MNQNIKEEVFRLKTKALRARYTLIFMIILSVVNVAVALFNTNEPNILMPFSCSISTYAVAFGIEISAHYGNSTFLIIGIIVAVLILTILLICYFKSKNNVIFLVASFGIVLVDTLALVILSIGSIGTFIESSNLFTDIVVHVLVLWYIANGIKASKQLGDINNAPNDLIMDECGPYKDDDNNDTETEISKPLSQYVDDGIPPLVSGSISGLKVFAVIHNGNAELVVNQQVCDSLNVAYLDEFELRAIVNNIDFNFQYRRSYEGEAMYLYADNQLLDSLNRK